MDVAGLILPVFAVIVTGWAAGLAGYVSRDLSDKLIHFAYNVAMPALLDVSIAQEPAASLLAWRFLTAFGGGSLICFGVPGGAHAERQWSGSVLDAGVGRLHDKHWLRHAAGFAGDLWTARGAAGGDRVGCRRKAPCSRAPWISGGSRYRSATRVAQTTRTGDEQAVRGRRRERATVSL